ncbi:MAG: DUF4859 domain-containing protein, partial [Bacteroidales bacterium]|nr:DUF4859 domain-containing protein [Bacteroidales bacterium]
DIDSIVWRSSIYRLYKGGSYSFKSYSDFQYLSFQKPPKQIFTQADDLKNLNLNSSSSQYCWERSRESENFICFWEAGLGSDPINAGNKKVDVDDLLAKAEIYYDVYKNRMKFIVPGESKADKYKMIIFLWDDDEWGAYGGGSSDVIGAIWVNYLTCQPTVGATIAHEIGHAFQYQTYSDYRNGCGWRYGYGANTSGGNGFWEQCANWQAYDIYPGEKFTNYNFGVYLDNYHKHILHETPRYANYFIQDYWVMKHGEDFIGKLWRGARSPEDPVEAYKRLTGIDQAAFNDEMYDCAARLATWDIDKIRDYGKNYIGRQSVSMTQDSLDYWQIKPERCPENYGYNVIRLNIPQAGKEVRAHFVGLAGAEGYRKLNVDKAGWRYGFVVLKENGKRVYSDMFSNANDTAHFVVPDSCSMFWMVVSGAPTTHWRHAWDDDDSNDEQWPYKVKFEQTNLYGQYDFPEDYQRYDTTLYYQVELPYSSSAYLATSLSINIDPVCMALGLTGTQLKTELGNKLKFVGFHANGTYTTTPTANGDGHWFSAAGNVISYNNTTCYLYSEYQKGSYTFNIGQYPGRCTKGAKYTIRQGFRYQAPDSKTYQVMLVFNVTII